MSDEDRVCENCGRWIERPEILYRVRMDLFAEPTIQIDEPPALPGHEKRRWEDLLRQLEQMDDQQVQEATDQVHERIEFNLCGECRKDLHRRIKARKVLE